MPRWLPLLLGYVTALGPLATDMYLPAFPTIEGAMGTGPGTAQVTLAAWFAGLAAGQLLQGTLADRFGRRAPLLAGTALFTVASLGCALAPDMTSLTLFRGLQALGGSASMVIPRAVVRDLADGVAAARLMARLMLVMGAAPILAPSLGGLLLTFGDWRLIFWTLACYGLSSVLLVGWALPETLPPARRVALAPGELLARYAAIARERAFLTHALMGASTMFALFSFIAAGPPVFIGHFGVSPQGYAALFGVSAAAFIAGSQATPPLAARFGPHRVLRAANRAGLACLALLVAAAASGTGGMAAVVALVAAAMACGGCVMPNASVGALSRHAAHAGSASALMGMLQFALAALAGALAGLVGDGTPLPMALLMLGGVLSAAAADRFRPAPAAAGGGARR
ncbi:multidrug effflux MFS transporter [Caldovatus aquaticus]|uniref:Bcr/CflA family efflux transporter n=1 Tax=Caldovatus aquaticus TaxID=2865671 RepID=A0ABS7F650_9PROT|nr:multidrug effflux MFS transporter [Caldovatus aquaticus]MBW8270265.1 multidrug effflux MFS transporter [Caldovatus aquaticus]